VVGEYPGFLPGLFWMARIYFEQERVEEAGKLLDRVLELDPELKIAASLSEKMLTGEDFLEYSLPRVSLQNGPPEPAPKSVDSLKSRDVWRVPFAVAISNTKSDRPQSGLDLAERVYEFPIEDGNTILLACYGLVDMAATPLGPVTRLDSYFLEEVFPLDPLMIHKGSSPGGTRTAKKLGMEMVDQKIGYDAFWDILKPDTKPKTFTSLQRLKDIAYTRGIIAGNIFKGLKITKTGHPYEENRILSLHIPFSKNYTVSYRFSQQTGQYLRSINGVLHQDAESGATLQAENLIVQMVDEIVLSPSRLKTIQVIGSGKLHSFVKGKYFEGTWKRPSIEAYTQYYDQKGNEVFLLPGKTWIHFLSNHSSIKVETWKKVSGGEG